MITGSTRGVATEIGRNLASRLGQRDELARVVRLLREGACLLIPLWPWVARGGGEV